MEKRRNQACREHTGRDNQDYRPKVERHQQGETHELLGEFRIRSLAGKQPVQCVFVFCHAANW